MTLGDISVGIDWNDDHFICWDARPGDALNLIPTPLDLYHLTRNNFSDTGTYSVPGQNENFSQQYMKHVVIGSGNMTFYKLRSLTNGVTYTASAWVSTQTGETAQNMGIYKYNSGDPGDTASYTLVGSTQSVSEIVPTRHNITFTANATVDYYLGFTSTAITHGYLYAVMVIVGSNTTQGYNTGLATDLYDHVQPLNAEFSNGGGDEQTLITSEGTASVKVDNASRLYSPEYTASPLHGFFTLNHIMRIRVNDGTNDVILWTGYVDEYNPDPVFNPGSVSIHATQGIFYLDRVVSDFSTIIDSNDYEYVTAIKKLFLGIVPSAGDRYEFVLDTSPLDYSYISSNNDPTLLYTGINDWETAIIKIAEMELYSVNNKTTIRELLTRALTVDRGFFCIDRFGFPAYFTYAHTWDDALVPIELSLDTEASKGTYEYAKKVFNQSVISRTRGTTTTTTVELWRTRTSVVALRGKYKKPRVTKVTAVFKKEEGADVIVDTISAFGAGSTLTVTTPGGSTPPASFYTATITQNQGGAVINFTNLSTIDLTFVAILNGTIKNNFGDYVTTYSNEANIADANVKELRVSSDLFYDDGSTDSLGEYLVWYLGHVNGTIRTITLRWRSDAVVQKALSLSIGSLVSVTGYQTGQTAERYQVIGESWSWSPQIIEQTLTLKRSYPIWIAEQSDMSGDVTLGYGN
jgi:hypothetical protein